MECRVPTPPSSWRRLTRPSNTATTGERFALVLSRSIRISFGDEHYDLEAGDTLHYAAHETDEAHQTGDGQSRILIISNPAFF